VRPKANQRNFGVCKGALLGQKISTQNRPDGEEMERVNRDICALNIFRHGIARENESTSTPHREGLKRRAMVAPIGKNGGRGWNLAPAILQIAFGKYYEPVRIA
jgi:hypothetical protein